MISLAEFRAEASRFLSNNAVPLSDSDPIRWGHGSDDVSIQYGTADRPAAEELAKLELAKQWQMQRFDAGFGWIHGPERYGGRNLPQAYTSAFDELESRYDVPSRLFFANGHGLVGPTILTAGTEELCEQYLRPLYRGEVVACQLFSEPQAGSDLASLTTSAERVGTDWIVNGHKVWTSGAQYSEIGLLLARTDRSVPKHRGLTMFLVDMHATGVDVRPLRQMTGGAHFNEVYLTAVRVPDSHRLGMEGSGWDVARGTLAKERASVAPGGSNSTMGVDFDRLKELVQHMGGATQDHIRQKLMHIYCNERLLQITAERLLARSSANNGPGPELSMCKLAATNNLQATSDLVSTVLGPRLAADTGEWGTFAWTQYVLAVPGCRFGGGTDEIQRNVLAERVLGLPK